MATTPQQIDLWRAHRSEHQRLEFKEAKVQFDNKKLFQYCVAIYQHCALRWVMREHMTNQSLRERFNLPERKSATVSQIIAATIDAGIIKLDERVGSSRKLARYLPAWA
ncbi:MAG: hypothetical protein WD768_14605 [Phycisphaeraceae bacterium]